MQKNFFELLNEEREKGATIFFSSHILSEVQKMCDRVAIIKDGQLVKVERIETLTKNNLKKVNVLLEDGKMFHSTLEGIINLEHDGDNSSFLYSGRMKDLLQHIHTMDISDISIEEPSLEEVFMHFYE